MNRDQRASFVAKWEHVRRYREEHRDPGYVALAEALDYIEACGVRDDKHAAEIRAMGEKIRQQEFEIRQLEKPRKDLAVQLKEAERRAEYFEAKALRWQRIRKPGHGSCCTCQGCGLPYDECRCDLDEMADELDETRAELDALRKAQDNPDENRSK